MDNFHHYGLRSQLVALVGADAALWGEKHAARTRGSSTDRTEEGSRGMGGGGQVRDSKGRHRERGSMRGREIEGEGVGGVGVRGRDVSSSSDNDSDTESDDRHSAVISATNRDSICDSDRDSAADELTDDNRSYSESESKRKSGRREQGDEEKPIQEQIQIEGQGEGEGQGEREGKKDAQRESAPLYGWEEDLDQYGQVRDARTVLYGHIMYCTTSCYAMLYCTVLDTCHIIHTIIITDMHVPLTHIDCPTKTHENAFKG